MASLAEVRSKYAECLKSLHVTMDKELVDNKHAKYLSKLFSLRLGNKLKKVIASIMVMSAEPIKSKTFLNIHEFISFQCSRLSPTFQAKLDRDDRYLCPHGNERVEVVDLDELR